MATGHPPTSDNTAQENPPKILLLFPPQWTPQNPHFALTVLAGHLRAKGYEVKTVDLNILFYTDVLTRSSLEWARNRAMLEHKFLADKLGLQSLVEDFGPDFERDGEKALAISKYIEDEDEGAGFKAVPGLIEDSVAALRDPKKFYDPEQFNYNMGIVERALEIYSLPFWPSRLQFNFFDHPQIELSLEGILKYIRDEHNNMFLRFYNSQMSTLVAEHPDVISISINAFSQLLPGLSLAYELKKSIAPDVHLLLGGNFFTRLIENLRNRPEFFDHFCDSVCFGEGERPLMAVLDAVAEKRSLEHCPNLIYPTDDGGVVRVTEECEPEPLETRGFHDLDGLPLHLYITPESVICLEASKGCYWGRCTFCDSFFGVKRDQASVERMVNEMKHLRKKWGVRHFEFSDECMTPEFMERMSERIIEEKLDVNWLCNGRLERTFTKERLQKYYDAGLRMVLWGFESGSRRIMDLINKGVDFEERWQVLRDANEVGLWNNGYIFFGFPTESQEEAEATINAICENTDLIHSYGRSVFSLGKQSLLRSKAKEYGIVSMLEDTQEFSTDMSFESTGGMSDPESRLMMGQCTQRAAAAYGGSPLWMYLRYREDLHLYICHHGRKFVQEYRVGSEEVTEYENVW